MDPIVKFVFIALAVISFSIKIAGNYHTGTYCSWYGKGDQTGEWGVSRPSFPTIIGIGIDYDNCKVSWYVNGNLKYDKTLSSWSYNRDSDSNIYKYTSIYYDESYISSLNIYREDIKYLPEGYNSFADVNYQYKIFDMKDNYGLK